jgi:hypothetical protein
MKHEGITEENVGADGTSQVHAEADNDEELPLLDRSAPPDLIGEVLASLAAERNVHGPTPLEVLHGEDTPSAADLMDGALTPGLAEDDEPLPSLRQPPPQDLAEEVLTHLAAERASGSRQDSSGGMGEAVQRDGSGTNWLLRLAGLATMTAVVLVLLLTSSNANMDRTSYKTNVTYGDGAVLRKSAVKSIPAVSKDEAAQVALQRARLQWHDAGYLVLSSTLMTIALDDHDQRVLLWQVLLVSSARSGMDSQISNPLVLVSQISNPLVLVSVDAAVARVLAVSRIGSTPYSLAKLIGTEHVPGG